MSGAAIIDGKARAAEVRADLCRRIAARVESGLRAPGLVTVLVGDDPASKVHPLAVADTCGACHADPEHMAGYRLPARGGGDRPIPTDQRERYGQSVHAHAMTEKGDLSAPTCNDCHGNHGATPPEVRSVANVCAQCHSRPA